MTTPFIYFLPFDFIVIVFNGEAVKMRRLKKRIFGQKLYLNRLHIINALIYIIIVYCFATSWRLIILTPRKRAAFYSTIMKR